MVKQTNNNKSNSNSVKLKNKSNLKLLTKEEIKQNKHLDNQNVKYKKAVTTEVIYFDDPVLSCDKLYKLSDLCQELNQIEPKDFLPQDQSTSKYVIICDLTFKEKFKSLDNFDEQLNSNILPETLETFNKFLITFEDQYEDQGKTNYNKFFKLKRNSKIKIENINIDINEQSKFVEEKEKERNIFRQKQNINKAQFKYKYINKIIPQTLIDLKQKIFVQLLYLNDQKSIQISEITKININTCKTIINKMKQGKYKRCLLEVPQISKIMSYDQISELFHWLDSSYSEEINYKTIKNKIKNNFSIDVKKNFVQTILKQGNQVNKKGDLSSKAELDSRKKISEMIWKLIMDAKLLNSGYLYFTCDEQGQYYSNNMNTKVWCKKGKIKNKYQKKRDKKWNNIITFNQKSIFSWQMSEQCYNSISFDNQFIETFAEMTKYYKDRNQKFVLALDFASFHNFGPTLNKVKEINELQKTKNIVYFISAAFSKSNICEFGICRLKQLQALETVGKFRECRFIMDKNIRSLDENDVAAIQRRGIRNWIKLLYDLNSRRLNQIK